MTDSILKSRDITLLTKVHLVKGIVFPVVTYGCESWTTKKAEYQRIDAFKIVVKEMIVESPLNCKEIKSVNPRGNQSCIFIGKTETEAENSNTLATCCEELTHWKRPCCWERLRSEGEGDDRG